MDTKLAQALKFTEDDLAANREGRITQAQMLRLRLSIRREIAIAWIVVSSFVFAILFSSVLSTLARGNRVSTNAPSLFQMMFVVLVIILSSVSFWRWQALREDLRGGSVSVSGQAQLKVRGRKGLEITVSTQTFRVGSQEAFLAFHNDEHYHIYYAPRTKSILSAELMVLKPQI